MAFIPFGFYKAPSTAGFDPESFGSLYYWWDFTDSSTMTLNGSNVLSQIDNKAARTSQNETLNAVDGSPTFQSAAAGTLFNNESAISNTAAAGTGGNLDTLSNSTNATVITITKLATLTDPNGVVDDTLWGFAGTGADDLAFGVHGRTSSWSNNVIATGDNAISSTYNRQVTLRDWRGTDKYGTRTYTSTQIPANNSTYQMYGITMDYSSNQLNNKITRNDQTQANVTTSTVSARNNTGSNRGFKVNARSRSGATFTANQYLQHILIYNGLLDDTAISNIYTSWGG